jgi:hypothetical protein
LLSELTSCCKTTFSVLLEKAHAEYEIFKQKQLAKPSEVEKHFIEAEKKLKQLGNLKDQDDKKTK